MPEDENQPVQEAEDVESLKGNLAQEREKADRYLANWQRAEADLINFRKRVEQEKEEIAQFANAALMLNLLPALDDFERALDNVSSKLAGLPWVDGIRLIHRKLQLVLEAYGLSPIDAVGKDFDPALHEVVLQGEGEEGKVIEELRRGYRLHDRVLRPAMVKVGQGEKKGESDEQ
jgi:molecular chaperone GrpE